MALVSVTMTGIAMFSDMGIAQSVIQNKRGDDPSFLNTAWTMHVGRGFVLWLVACALAWPVALYYQKGDPMAHQLIWVLPVVGFTSVLSGLCSTSLFTLSRKLELKTLTFIDLASQIFSLTVTITWAIISPSIWALVAGNLASYAVRLPLSHWINKAHPNRLEWDKTVVKEITRFGTWIMFSTMVTFLALNLDRILLGRLLSLGELGLYSMALNLASVGVQVVINLNNSVLFPLVTKFRDDEKLMVQRSIQARKVILLVGGSISTAFFILAPLFFRYCYDPRYAGAGIIAQWLSIYIFVNILLSSMDYVTMALGHTRHYFVSRVLTVSGYAFAVPGYHFAGLPGFILGICCGVLAAHLFLVFMLPALRWQMLMQSGVFSLIFLLYGGAFAIFLQMKAGSLGSTQEILWSLVAALLPCTVAGLISMKSIREFK